MITEKEKQSTLLSTTAKDYYQIWQELLETAGKLSERWSPESTNESDPGIILLKVLTAVADKLNYNIDKNILEAFMPSAAQEESMRKLCDMMGYNMKYYRSATTDILVYFNSSDDKKISYINGGQLTLPKYNQFTNIDGNITYTSLENAVFSKYNKGIEIPCIEGTINYCEADNDGIVTLNNLDDNYRYYFPVTNVAENGIFITNLLSDSDRMLESENWQQVTNLNIYPLGTSCYKFGYDSKQFLPYVQFPEDIGSLINDGLRIAYITTNGLAGNVSPKTLTNLVLTASTTEAWKNLALSSDPETTFNFTEADFKCYNASAASNGEDKESLNNAYKNFKKTIGTFDTLVTCRDYINKIYNLTVSVNDTTPLVSNVIVSDIRDDINNAITICTFQDYGIAYLDKSLTTGSGNAMDHFDLIVYPFNTLHNSNTKTEYDNTFKFDNSDTIEDIKNQLAAYKVIAHKLRLAGTDDIVCIKNYLKLNAKITTNTKVNSAEWQVILSNIKTELYKNFNARQLDFREAIPYDDILNVIQSADVNIKNVSLEEPALYTAVVTTDNKEYLLFDEYNDQIIGTSNHRTDADAEWMKSKFTAEEKKDWDDHIGNDLYRETMLDEKAEYAEGLYNKLLLRNILAGRIALFDYDTQFRSTILEAQAIKDPDANPTVYYDLVYPPDPIEPEPGEKIIPIITSIKPKLTIDGIDHIAPGTPVTLSSNQVVQFRAPQFDTITEYGAYVNYYFIRDAAVDPTASGNAQPAAFLSFTDFLNSEWAHPKNNNNEIINYAKNKYSGMVFPDTALKSITTEEDFTTYQNNYGGCIYNNIAGGYFRAPEFVSGTTYYVYLFNKDTFAIWNDWIKLCLNTSTTYLDNNIPANTYQGIYRVTGTNIDFVPGYLVDNSHHKFIQAKAWFSTTTPLTFYYVQDYQSGNSNNNGLGIDPVYPTIANNTEYALKDGEFLYINYTQSTVANGTGSEIDTNATAVTTSTIINKVYKSGTIIRPLGFNPGLMDSRILVQSKTYSKTKHSGTGYIWDEISVPGMFALGTNEKIEIRTPKETFVCDLTNRQGAAYNPTYIYFSTEDKPEGNIITFLDAWTGTETDECPSKVLKENEYFWYTDINKQTLTFVGAGSKIINHSTRAISKPVSSISTEDILEKGLSVIPWVTIPGLYKESESNNGEYIKWQEYQYITLTDGDILESIEPRPEQPGGAPATQLTNEEWILCDSATYKFKTANQSETLPLLSNIDSPDSSVPYSWEANCKLALKTGPDAAQELTTQTIEGNDGEIEIEESLEVYYNNNEYPEHFPKLVLTSKGTTNTISIKTNYLLDTIADNISTTWHQYNSEGEQLDTLIEDFKIKTFVNNEAVVNYTDDSEQTHTVSVPLYNTNKYYTSLLCGTDTFGNMDWYVSIPKPEQKALMMVYFSTISDQSTAENQKSHNPYFEIGPQHSGETISNGLKIYNLTPDWWPNLSESNKYYLRKGINIIEILENMKLTLYKADSANIKDFIIFSPIDIVNGINSALNYRDYDANLLDAINNKDPEHQFYYNAIIEDSLAIELNTAKQEKMSNPAVWYNYNNINNKFVISEIDSDYLSQGITLAKTSQK